MLDEYAGTGRELTFGQPAHRRGQISDRCWGSVGRSENVASGHVDVGTQPTDHRLPGHGQIKWTVGSVDCFNDGMRTTW